jgi:hypothetical protein
MGMSVAMCGRLEQRDRQEECCKGVKREGSSRWLQKASKWSVWAFGL